MEFTIITTHLNVLANGGPKVRSEESSGPACMTTFRRCNAWHTLVKMREFSKISRWMSSVSMALQAEG